MSLFPGYTEYICLISIDGSDSLEAWAGSDSCAADALPGEYDFGVKQKMAGGSLFGLVAFTRARCC